ncbi:hypothetical protein KI688_012788 [Linnemannia hyalina]|uniref:F-box domain-containing protein n=1 Tax=Linnemannia hyalina TaxID=64524 RepID=A0A9P7XTJ9_9FUNG|nr:hypothetical protein KI688_012788 [Linnemannia hyalina]
MSNNINHISIFDIPALLDSICDNLSRNQVAACLQVSRSWHDLFLPLISRFVKVDYVSDGQAKVQSILDRAAVIRSLEINLSDGVLFLDRRVVCTNLRRLYCLDSYDFDSSPESEFSDFPNTTNPMALVCKNPQLEMLHFQHRREAVSTKHFTLSILESLLFHSSLTQIKVRIVEYEIAFLHTLVQHLPSTLRDLECSGWRCNVSPSIVQELPLLDWPSTSLRKLCLHSTSWYPFEEQGSSMFWSSLFFDRGYLPESVVVPLVAKCPLLQEFTIGDYKGDPQVVLQALTDSCPDLEIVNLHGCDYVPLPLDPPEATTTAVPGSSPLRGRLAKLREFRMHIWNQNRTQDEYQNLADWILRSASTLEVIKFEMNDYQWNSIQYPWSLQHVTNADLLDSCAWSDCSRLRKFRVRMRQYHTIICCLNCDGEVDVRPPECLPRALLEDLVRPSEWQCTELESLDLLVRDAPSPVSANVEIALAQENEEPIPLTPVETERMRQKFACEIGQLFWRLKSLPKLSVIKLKWDLSEAVTTVALEDLLDMINKDILEAEDEDERSGESWDEGEDEREDEREDISTAEVDIVAEATGPRKVKYEDLAWLGLGSVFWTRREYEFNAAENSSREHPPHEFDHPEHPIHRRVGHGWRDWDVVAGRDGDDNSECDYMEDPIVSRTQFEVMTKTFEGANGFWGRRARVKKGGRQGECLSQQATRLERKKK